MGFVELVKEFLKVVEGHRLTMATFLLMTVLLIGGTTSYMLGHTKSLNHYFGLEEKIFPAKKIWTHSHPKLPISSTSNIFDQDLCDLKHGLKNPEPCHKQYECSLPPVDFDYEACMQKYADANIFKGLPPPPQKYDGRQKYDNRMYHNDIHLDATNIEYIHLHSLTDAVTSKIVYLVIQPPGQNWTIRTISCPAEGAKCMISASRDGYVNCAVQKYAKTILYAVDMRTRAVNKVFYRFKSNCVCKYFRSGTFPHNNGNKTSDMC